MSIGDVNGQQAAILSYPTLEDLRKAGNLEDLMEKSTELTFQSKAFKESSKDLGNRMWRRKACFRSKAGLAVIATIAAIALIVTGIVLRALGKEPLATALLGGGGGLGGLLLIIGTVKLCKPIFFHSKNQRTGDRSTYTSSQTGSRSELKRISKDKHKPKIESFKINESLAAKRAADDIKANKAPKPKDKQAAETVVTKVEQNWETLKNTYPQRSLWKKDSILKDLGFPLLARNAIYFFGKDEPAFQTKTGFFTTEEVDNIVQLIKTTLNGTR